MKVEGHINREELKNSNPLNISRLVNGVASKKAI